MFADEHKVPYKEKSNNVETNLNVIYIFDTSVRRLTMILIFLIFIGFIEMLI